MLSNKQKQSIPLMGAPLRNRENVLKGVWSPACSGWNPNIYDKLYAQLARVSHFEQQYVSDREELDWVVNAYVDLRCSPRTSCSFARLACIISDCPAPGIPGPAVVDLDEYGNQMSADAAKYVGEALFSWVTRLINMNTCLQELGKRPTPGHRYILRGVDGQS